MSLESDFFNMAYKCVGDSGKITVESDESCHVTISLSSDYTTSDIIDTTSRSVPLKLPQSAIDYLPVYKEDPIKIPNLDTIKSNLRKEWTNECAKLFAYGQDKNSFQPFSKGFQSCIGTAPTENTHGIGDYNLAARFFHMFTEHTIAEIYIAKDFGRAWEFWKILNAKFYITLASGGVLEWSGAGECGRGLIGLVARFFVLDLWDARATVANVAQINFPYLVSLSSAHHPRTQSDSALTRERIPITLIDPTSVATIATLRDRQDIFGYSGQKVAAFLLYELAGQEFCVPASVEGGNFPSDGTSLRRIS